MKKVLSVLVVALLVVSLMSTAIVNGAPNNLNGAAKFMKEKFNLTENDLKVVKTSVDEFGYKHVRMQQVVDGIPVYGQEYIVHFDKNSEVYASSGNVDIRAKGFNKGKYINENKAIEIAKTEVNFTKGEELQADQFSANLYLYNVNNEYVPAYVTRVNWLHEDTMGDWFVFVNAVSGEVLKKYNNIRETATVGTGIGVLGDTKSINLDLVSGKYYLTDRTKLAELSTYNANYRTKLPGTLMYSTDTIWDASVEAAAVDAHVYAGDTYNYYYTMFGRNSIDGNGMTIKSTVHYKRDYVNAFWNGTQMVYGDGDGTTAVALSASLDVIAHEMTHGVDSYEANLVYADESGALSESFSDVFGTLVEFYAQPSKADWLCGEDCWTPAVAGDALRSLEDPTIFGDPAHMDDYLYTSQDNGGVHTNCGIPNHAAYHVGQLISLDKMARIYYRALSTYMTASCTFTQCRAALLQSATDLYGANGTEYNAIVSAFDSVGIY